MNKKHKKMNSPKALRFERTDLYAVYYRSRKRLFFNENYKKTSGAMVIVIK